LARAGHVSVPLGLGVVVFEKMLDVAALAVFMLVGVGMLLAKMMSGGNTVAGTGDASSVLSFAGLVMAAGLGLAAVGGVALLYFVPLEKLPGLRRFFEAQQRSRHCEENDGREDCAGEGFAGKVSRLMRGAHATMATLRARGARREEIVMLSFVIWILHLAQIYLFFASVNA